MGFTICYSFEGNRVVLERAGYQINAHDAVCYALRHSGVAIKEHDSKWSGNLSSIIEIADRCGVTDVRWHRSITYPHE